WGLFCFVRMSLGDRGYHSVTGGVFPYFCAFGMVAFNPRIWGPGKSRAANGKQQTVDSRE
ncbi:MAG: hypothetical protein ACE5JC_06790, partial [Candidatus Zixiibacteriota bacterium]